MKPKPSSRKDSIHVAKNYLTPVSATLTEKVRCASASHPEQQESLESEINPQPDTGTVGYTILIRVTGFEVHTRAATETFRHSE